MLPTGLSLEQLTIEALRAQNGRLESELRLWKDQLAADQASLSTLQSQLDILALNYTADEAKYKAEIARLQSDQYVIDSMSLDSRLRGGISLLSNLVEDWHSPLWDTDDGQELMCKLRDVIDRMDTDRPTPSYKFYMRLRTQRDSLQEIIKGQTAEIEQLRAELANLQECYGDRDGDLDFEHRGRIAAEAQVERLRVALLEFGNHDMKCAVHVGWGEPGDPCDCGLEAALSGE